MLSRQSLALFLLTAAGGVTAKCQSWGIDFQDEQTYFQNSLSSDPFTFAQRFTGCNADSSQNIIVPPGGDQTQCTDTPLTPDDTPQLSTCPMLKNQLESGDYSIIVISNNGDGGDPIGYQRDFSLSVGPQATATVTPTITVDVTVTPIVNVTQTATDLTTLPAVTTTVPSLTVKPTKTVTPVAATVTSVKVLATLTKPVYSVSVTKVTKLVTPTCTTPARQPNPDKTAKIRPTIVQAAVFAQATGAAASTSNATSIAAGKGRRMMLRDLDNLPKFLSERRARLAAANGGIIKRAPDQPTITVTEENTALYPTVTSTISAAAQTATITDTIISTVTPAPITVESGKTTAAVVTTTLPQKTKTQVKYTLAWVTQTKVVKYTQTITKTVAPSASVTACRRRGGHLGIFS